MENRTQSRDVQEKKTGIGVTFGYGLGSMVRTGENLWGFYLSYFMVTVVGIRTTAAGNISSAALIIASVACIFFGYLSDNSKSKRGKRRPFMILAIVPCVVLMSLIFVNVGIGTKAVVYYAIVCIAFYLFYYLYLVPYDSLGAELTVDYNARTRIRTLCTIILYVSVFVGGTLVMLLQTVLQTRGIGSEGSSWTAAVLISCSLPMLVCGLIAWGVTKGKEEIPQRYEETAEEAPRESILKSYGSVLKIRSFLGIALWSLIYFIGNTILAGTTVYFGVYTLGLTEAQASTYFTISMVVTIIMAVPGNFLSAKLGKKRTLLFAICVYIVIGLIVYFKQTGGYFDGVLTSVGYGVTNSLALICSYAMVYDVGEVTEFKLGVNKTAAAVGVYTFGMGIAQAIGYAAIGYILAFAGFDASAAVQSDAVTHVIKLMVTIIPIILFVVSGLIVLFLYKINAKNHEALVEALKAKKAGEDYSTEEFKELL